MSVRACHLHHNLKMCFLFVCFSEKQKESTLLCGDPFKAREHFQEKKNVTKEDAHKAELHDDQREKTQAMLIY